MNVTLDIMGRNLRLYFRDRLGVFFSLLAAIILYLLYSLFLGNLQTTGSRTPSPTRQTDQSRRSSTAGPSPASSASRVTTGLGAFSAFVEDGTTGRFRDFQVSPIKRTQLILGHLLSSFVIAVIGTMLVHAASVAYLFFVNVLVLTVQQLVLTVGYLLLSCAAYAALSAFVVSFVKTQGAFSALSTIVGTVLGFLCGGYIPVGALPERVANVINALLFGQPSMLIRQQFSETALVEFAGDQPQAVGDWDVTAGYVVVVLAAMAVVFTSLAALRIRSRIRYSPGLT